ncbi:MAG: translation initiation factor IF-2 [Pirellulaceae bacterium]|nr:translation initiation factor IF-2 [Pirellulaceae bacterium]
MSVRIYALAKELGIDNKELLGVCDKLGIKGKGSALASLDDDEVSRIKGQLAGAGEKSPPAKPKPERPASVKPLSKPKTILGSSNRGGAKSRQPELAETAEANEPADLDASVVAEAATPVETVSKGETADSANAPKRPERPERPGRPIPVRRAPASRSGEVRDLDSKSRSGRGKSSSQREPKRPGINIKVAAMPEVKQPSASSKPKEKVQKPDIALPQEAIRDAMRKQAKSGTSAPLQDFTKAKTRPAKKGKGSSAPTGPVEAQVPAGPLTGRRRTKKGGRGAAGEEKSDTALGSTRQSRPARRRPNRGDDDRYSRRRPQRRRNGPVANTAAPRKDNISLELPCSVRAFSEAAGIPSVKVCLTVQQISDSGMPNINSMLDEEIVAILIEQFGVENLDTHPAESLEDKLIDTLEKEDDPASLLPRPPVVTFLGHVDHGKTSLLDAIIGINVVSGEAGGITQHIRAYEIEKQDQKIAFVDTPGHEAFTEMRARGANVTDIAVLVVAADDGVMPQTEEAISHAKAAGVPIIVALNKIDLPGADADKALQDLASHELLPSEWGGDIEVVRTSATKGEGIDELLETILVTAELHEYKANPNRAAMGTCLEAEQQPGRGVIAKLMVQNGTLNVGDVVVCGASHGRVKALYNTLDVNRKEKLAGPSTPVNITGLDIAPEAGDRFYVLDDISDAREIAQSREFQSRRQNLSGVTTRVSLEEFQDRLETGTLGKVEDVVELNLIIRSDVRGSIEAIQKELGKLDHPDVRVKTLQNLVGGVTVADVRLAQASQAVIIGFNVVPDEAARALADELQVEIRRYEVIYKVTDDIKATLEGRLKPEESTVELGMAMVQRVFSISRVGAIAGCRVMRGNIERGCRIRLIRDSRIIGDYPLDSLKREKDDAKEVQRGMECGIKLSGYNDIKEGDTLEAYKIVEVARTL